MRIMKNRWRDSDAQRFFRTFSQFGEDLALRTYTARLIGQDRTLVLHGGGNTSVKTSLPSITRETLNVLCVKGSGWDLDSIEPSGHPAVRLDALRRLRTLSTMSDEEMV